MAFGTTPAGTLTKQATGIVSTRRFGVGDSENISKGNVLDINAAGFLIVAATDNVSDNVPAYVALEPANNSSGSDGDISCPVATPGHFVTVVAGGVIHPGDKVQRDTATAGRVIEFEPGTDDDSLAIGRYMGKEGGTIAKATSTPFAETFTDDADFVPVNSTATDVVEIQLGDI